MVVKDISDTAAGLALLAVFLLALLAVFSCNRTLRPTAAKATMEGRR